MSCVTTGLIWGDSWTGHKLLTKKYLQCGLSAVEKLLEPAMLVVFATYCSTMDAGGALVGCQPVLLAINVELGIGDPVIEAMQSKYGCLQVQIWGVLVRWPMPSRQCSADAKPMAASLSCTTWLSGEHVPAITPPPTGQYTADAWLAASRLLHYTTCHLG